MSSNDIRRGEGEQYGDDRNRDRLRSTSRDRFDASRGGRQQSGSLATRERDYYGDEGRSRGSQRVSPGGEYFQDRSRAYRNESYTDQGFGENRGRSDWRTEDQLFERDANVRRSTGIGTEAHRGRGPRSYRRSNERIREDVCESLTDDPHIDASNMEVSVTDCEVTLSGTVTSREDKRYAEYIAETTSGVNDVHNRLRIVSDLANKGETSSPMSDMTATQTAQH